MATPKLPTALVADPACKDHDTGPGHPESPARFDAAFGGIEKAGLLQRLVQIQPAQVSRKDLELVHTPEYLDLAEREIRAGEEQLSTGDTSVGPHSWDVACRAVGSALAAVDEVFSSRARNAFCVVRPPGHHATPSTGMGFCVLNNIAIAARYAQRRHGVSRVLIVDWDVHHGNGTQDAFYSDGSVFFFSTHQWPWYPGTGRAEETGRGEGKGATLNCPFPAFSGREEILGAVEKKLVPAMETFHPELVLISAGFDSRIDDPLGYFTLTDQDFRDLTRLVMNIADRHGQGRVVSILEGGYNLSGLATAVATHAQALAE